MDEIAHSDTPLVFGAFNPKPTMGEVTTGSIILWCKGLEFPMWVLRSLTCVLLFSCQIISTDIFVIFL